MRNWKKFCEEYAVSGNSRQAAIAAGYSPKTAHAQGSRLLRRPAVVEYLAQLLNKHIDATVLTRADRQKLLTEIANTENTDVFARLRAIDILNKMDGIYIQKISMQVTMNIADLLGARLKRYDR